MGCLLAADHDPCRSRRVLLPKDAPNAGLRLAQSVQALSNTVGDMIGTVTARYLAVRAPVQPPRMPSGLRQSLRNRDRPGKYNTGVRKSSGVQVAHQLSGLRGAGTA
jgi:hypothetical protein